MIENILYGRIAEYVATKKQKNKAKI